MQYFNGDGGVEPLGIYGPIDSSHAPLIQPLEQAIATFKEVIFQRSSHVRSSDERNRCKQKKGFGL